MNPFITKKILLAIAVFIISGILITGCKTKEKEEASSPLLKVLEIKSSKIPVYLEMVGQAVGLPTVEITARVEGYLQNWSFKEGSIVRKGQLLFTIEQDKYLNNVKYFEPDLASKTAAWEKAKLDVERLKPLLNTKAISQNDYDVAVTNEKQCKAAVESAQANLADSKLNLAYTTITSPINGYIGKVNVNPGNLVGHGESTLLTTISAIDPIYFDFQMNETDFLKIRRYLVESSNLTAAAQTAYDLSNQLFNARYASYLDVLNAQRLLFSAQINESQSRRDKLISVVKLYLALGGGWK